MYDLRGKRHIHTGGSLSGLSPQAFILLNSEPIETLNFEV